MNTFSLQSFGCRVNQAESFEWAEALLDYGFRLERNFERSDLIIINTCALTASAESEARQFIRRVKRNNPDSLLVITGCGVELLRAELEKNNLAKVIVPNDEKPFLLTRFLGLKEKKKEPETRRDRNFSFRVRALVKIQDGCSQACTFCIIPKVRGKSRSLPVEEILHRLRCLVAQGYREIVLAGIHLTSYGQDLRPPLSLLHLLEKIIKIEGLGRVRLSSLDPRAMNDALIDFISKEEKICPHFHFSFQHASPRLLRLMGRKGDPEEYARFLQRLRENSSLSAIGADIIVGFPGEEEQDFARLVDFVASSPLTYLHVFPYSPRPGTVAARWPQVSPGIKKDRARKLREIARQKNLAFRQSLVGHVLPGIIVRRRDAGQEILTANYIKVMAEANDRFREGEEIKVRLMEAKPEGNRGEIID